jgi:DNA-binding IscR family transcriptional regulator
MMDITFKEEEIKDKTLVKFNEIHRGAIDVFLVLIAYASKRTKAARITIDVISEKTGFSLFKVVRILNRLKEAEFIEAPFEGQQGKKQIYKLKILVGESDE